jgi:uncharacterized protein (DUF2252 family)
MRRLERLRRVEHHQQDEETRLPGSSQPGRAAAFANEGRHGSRWQAIASISAKIGGSALPLNE